MPYLCGRIQQIAMIMGKRLFLLMFSAVMAACSSEEVGQANAQPPANTGKTLVAYYSYTGNCRSIVGTLANQLAADVLEIQPAQKGQRYEANGYALGTQLLNAIKAAPDQASSYPAIDPVSTSLDDYQNIIIVTPLWWSQMAAIMQTFLFNYGPQMAGKHVGLIVSSASSSISQVVADSRRLVPDATWMGEALWINDRNRSNTATLVSEWLAKQNFQSATAESKEMNITINGQTQRVALAQNQAARALAAKLQDGPLTVTLNSSGGFEIWGPLGFSLPTSNEQIKAQPGDVVLYNGSNICLFYGSNSWSYTRLGRIEGLSEAELRSFLRAGESNISVTLSAASTPTTVGRIRGAKANDNCYTLSGQRTDRPSGGVYISNGKIRVKGGK